MIFHFYEKFSYMKSFHFVKNHLVKKFAGPLAQRRVRSCLYLVSVSHFFYPVMYKFSNGSCLFDRCYSKMCVFWLLLSLPKGSTENSSVPPVVIP